MQVTQNKRIAVIGAGISGITSAYILHKNGVDVSLYEKEINCGGHSLTDHSSSFPVDLGFQVFNLTTYPNFVAFLDELGIDSEPSDMSFSLSVDNGKLEWSGDNLDTLFAQRTNLLSLSFLRMVWEVVRFGREAPKILDPEVFDDYKDMSLSDYLDMNKYSKAFRRNYVLPICAAVWSAPESTMMQFPVITMIRFWVNHCLLDIFQRPVWRVVKGRSQEYVKKVIELLPTVHSNTEVLKVQASDEGDKVRVTTDCPQCDGTFDAVVMATHTDMSLKILGEYATEDQRKILQAIPYNSNDIYLHTDPKLMPKTRKTWASWNCISSSRQGLETAEVCVSYYINRLQTLPPNVPDFFVTLNPDKPPEASTIIRRLTLDHPIFTSEGIKAQKQLSAIQGQKGVYFAGAWCGYGFHEDGLKAGLDVARRLGGQVPWLPRSCSPKSTLMQSLYLQLFKRFGKHALSEGYLRLILPNGTEINLGNSSNSQDVDCSDWRCAPQTKAKVRVMDISMFQKLMTRHDIGLGEAYMNGDFEVDNLGAFTAFMAANLNSIQKNRSKMGLLNWVVSKALYLNHLSRSNTREGSRKNISEHYDAGNAMYSLFLDETMTYSAGIHAPGLSLKDAQLKKLDALIELAEISSNDHVLEIGCGWGSFAIRAVQMTGCKVTGITISKEQLVEAQLRVRSNGLSNKINLMFCDYRDIPNMGSYDKVVSIEMIEAVGKEHLHTYFSVVSNALRPGGCAVVQAITGADHRYKEYCRASDFIREHIFPGGHLPSLGAIKELVANTRITLTKAIDIGPHYAITLRNWREAWESKKSTILQIGYSERFWRKYQFYFAYCEAGFDSGYIQDYHLLFTKCDDRPFIPTPRPVPASASQPHTDIITQVLLCLYFFLIGTVITQHRYMWIMPVTATVYMVSSWLCKLLASPEQSLLNMNRQINNGLYLTFAFSSSLGIILYLLCYPEVLDLSMGNQNEVVSAVLNCYAAGFYSFQLWAHVQYRLYLESSWELLHFAVMLFFFGSGAYKHENSAFLSTILLSLSTQSLRLFKAVFGLQSTKSLQYLELASHIIFNVCLNAFQAVLVFRHPEAFSSRAYYLLALIGMLYINFYNFGGIVYFNI